jgi:transglutaminase-like putative cysteine protease
MKDPGKQELDRVTILNVRHTTVYRYSRPVRLGDHRLMLRPRDSHDLRLLQTSLKFSPTASLRWIHDVFGNSVAIASFAEPAAELRIESNLQLETFVVERPACAITPDAVSYPFIYSADDRIDLGRLTERHHPDPDDRLGAWARGFVRGNPTDTSALLADLNSGVAKWISYQSRDAEGTQTPIETLNRGVGSCRDFAVLLIEAARSLGFGARVVTGYLYNPPTDGRPGAAIGAGSTHAWADIYVPGSGWIAYDPTNGTINGGNLIRVAVTRDISQAVPIAGSFIGAPETYLGMTVEVAVVAEGRGRLKVASPPGVGPSDPATLVAAASNPAPGRPNTPAGPPPAS